jgi:hypothetical protein
MRFLIFLLASMFLASNAAAAVRACTVDLAGQGHVAVRALEAEGDEHPCPQSDQASRCLSHCTQSYSSDARQFPADAPFLVFAPAPALFHASIQAKPKLVVVALAPPIVGPPLTILFGNFRN